MKSLTFLCYLFVVTIADKQLKLEDIERDNLASEREVKQQNKPIKYSQPYNPPPYKTSSDNYGFTPLKSTNQDRRVPPSLPSPIQQEIQQEIRQEPIQEPVQYVNAQYYYQPQTQQPVMTQYQPYQQYQQYQQYENLPYIGDNQINSPQQYVYVQPSAATSNNVQMVIDSKGQVKYYMYLPVQYVKQEQISSPLQYRTTSVSHYNSVGPQIFTQEPDYHQAPNTESQYITQPQLPPEPHVQAGPQVNFIPIEKSQYTAKGEPQSLLDSYVPSVVQYQYYKQQQQQQQPHNSLSNLIKKSSSTSKPSQKAYSSQQVYVPSGSSELSYSVQIPTIYSKGYSGVKTNKK